MNTESSGLHRRLQVQSDWTKFDGQRLAGKSITELFSNTIPAIRHPRLLSTEEITSLVEVNKTMQVGSRIKTYYSNVTFTTCAGSDCGPTLQIADDAWFQFYFKRRPLPHSSKRK